MKIYTLGIDPGVANIGYAVTDQDGVLATSGVLNFIDNDSMCEAAKFMLNLVETYSVKNVYMERFVAYRGQNSSSTEYILMYIGAVVYALIGSCKIHLTRAIDWKPALCKYLVKTFKFDNPSVKFDKKFSIAAAEFIIKQKIKTNHEADAVCLSYMWRLNEKK